MQRIEPSSFYSVVVDEHAGLRSIQRDPRDVTITSFKVIDLRFPTSLDGVGSDAMHKGTNGSHPYIQLHTNHERLKGEGIAFSNGRGSELICMALEIFAKRVVGKTMHELTRNMGKTFALTNTALYLALWFWRSSLFPSISFTLKMAPFNMDRHANLIEALTEFYTVLVQLCIIVKPMMHIPDPISGIEGFQTNAACALEAGFSPEAVYVMARLPYVENWFSGPNEDGFEMAGEPEIMPSTVPSGFTFRPSHEPNVGDYEGLRYMDDDPMDDEYLIPGTCLRLSSQNIYGTTWIYDTETCLLREWKSFDGDPDVRGFDWAPTGLPTKMLGAWTEKYRKLQFIGYSGRVDFSPDEDWQVKERIPEHKLGGWQAGHDFRLAQLEIRDMYLECGWDVESKTQDKFNRTRFVEMRERFRRDVLEPLEDRMYRCNGPNRDCTMEALMRETPEELRQWTGGYDRRQEEL